MKISLIKGHQCCSCTVFDDEENEYYIYGGWSSIEEYLGGSTPITSRNGDSKPITKNNQYYLSWHISAALTNNGDGDSWLEKNQNNPELIISELEKMHKLGYPANITYVNQLTGSFVY